MADLCELLGLSPAAVRELDKTGVVIRVGRGEYDLDETTRRYCAQLRLAAAGRGGKLADERARLAKEQADLASLKAAAIRGDLVELAAVKTEWLGFARAVRAAMLALPTRVQAKIPHLRSDEVAAIDAEIRAALEELANAG